MDSSYANTDDYPVTKAVCILYRFTSTGLILRQELSPSAVCFVFRLNYRSHTRALGPGDPWCAVSASRPGSRVLLDVDRVQALTFLGLHVGSVERSGSIAGLRSFSNAHRDAK